MNPIAVACCVSSCLSSNIISQTFMFHHQDDELRMVTNEMCLFFQLLRLDSLSVYWNVASEMYYHTSREQILVIWNRIFFMYIQNILLSCYYEVCVKLNWVTRRLWLLLPEIHSLSWLAEWYWFSFSGWKSYP